MEPPSQNYSDVAASASQRDPSVYCLLETIRKWPYKRLSPIHQGVLKRYFDKEPFFGRQWDIYTVECSPGVHRFAVPIQQAMAFLSQTEEETAVTMFVSNKHLDCTKDVPPGSVFTFVGSSMTLAEYEHIATLPEVRTQGMASATNAVNRGGMDLSKPAPSARPPQTKKKGRPQAEGRLEMLKAAADIVANGASYLFLSIDVETWEKNHDIVTELGLSRCLPRALGETAWGEHIHTSHFIVNEHRYYKNGDYVADASANFEFGKTAYVSLAKIPELLSTFLDTETTLTTNRQVVLVGHDIRGDIECLCKLGPDMQRHLRRPTMTFDTLEMWKGLRATSNGISLNRLCTELEIDAWNLHNAGNDAHYTLMAFFGITREYCRQAGLRQYFI